MNGETDRRHPFVALDAQAIQRVANTIFPGTEIRSAVLLTEGRCNTNLQVVVGETAQTFRLRLVAGGAEACRREAAFARAFSRALPVPACLLDDSDGHLIGHPLLALEWVEGRSLDSLLENRDACNDWASLGARVADVLSRIHSFRFDAAGDIHGAELVKRWDRHGVALFLETIEKSLQGRAGARLGPATARALWEVVLAESGILVGMDEPACLVHGDFKPGNMLVDADCEIGAVLDWEWVHAGAPIMDLGNLLRWHVRMPQAFVESLLGSYSGPHGPLGPDWEKSTRLVDLLAQLEFLSSDHPRGWTHRDATMLVLETIQLFRKRE